MDSFRCIPDSKSETMGGTLVMGSPRVNEDTDYLYKRINENSIEKQDDLVRFGSMTRFSQYELNEILHEELLAFEQTPCKFAELIKRVVHRLAFSAFTQWKIHICLLYTSPSPRDS